MLDVSVAHVIVMQQRFPVCIEATNAVANDLWPVSGYSTQINPQVQILGITGMIEDSKA